MVRGRLEGIPFPTAESRGQPVRRGIWSHWSGGVVGAILATILCAGIGVSATFAARAQTATKHRRAEEAAAAARTRAREAERVALVKGITFAPAAGSTNVPPGSGVIVRAATGRLTSVELTAGDHRSIPGVLANGATVWIAKQPVDPSTTYHIAATAAGSDGVVARVTNSFSTAAPTANVGTTVWPSEGLTVGVGQPIVFRFDHFVSDASARTRVEHAITITTSRAVVGGWYWFNNKELHFRPKTFWTPGTKVTVAVDLSGWNAGDGMWGIGAQTVHFTIGPSHIATANLATHQMTVTENGRVIATYPMSGGRPKYPTMNGTHLVLDRESVVHMVSSTNGIPVNSPDGYDELVYNDVHISDSGEYVHAAPWSVHSQGVDDVSHGCINLSNENSLAFFNFSRVGDIVQVVGGPRPPERGDHGVMDWDTPWDQWTPASVVYPHPTTHKALPTHASPTLR